MKDCLMCAQEIFDEQVHYTDGKIFLCNVCAGRYTFHSIVIRAMNNGFDSNVKRVYVAPIEAAANAEYGKTAMTMVDHSEEGQGEQQELGYTPDVIPEVELESDIENLSFDDFLCKYIDRPDLIQEYCDWHDIDASKYV